MAPVSTPALVLHGFRYGESSKIVRLLTRDHGVQSAIAKGALNPKSKFGARLQVLSEGVAQIYFKTQRDLHTLAEFEVTTQRSTLARDVRRFAAGAALAELIMRCSPAEPHPEIFDLASASLEHIATVPTERIDVAALRVLWAAVAALGFAPSIDTCARDGRRLPDGTVAFSVPEGGFLCRTCAREAGCTSLKPPDRLVLERLIAGPDEPAEPLSGKHAAAHRRLLVRFIEQHVAEGRELAGVTFWAGLA